MNDAHLKRSSLVSTLDQLFSSGYAFCLFVRFVFIVGCFTIGTFLRFDLFNFFFFGRFRIFGRAATATSTFWIFVCSYEI